MGAGIYILTLMGCAHQQNLSSPQEMSPLSAKSDIAFLNKKLREQYPYRPALEEKWNDWLREALREAENASTLEAELKVLQHYLSNLNDGHVAVFHPKIERNYHLPFFSHLIDNHVIVSEVYAPATGKIFPGDRITKINQVSTEQLLSINLSWVSARNQKYRFIRAMDEALTCNKDVNVELEIERDTKVVSVNAICSQRLGRISENPRHPPVYEKSHGIWIVDATGITTDILATNMPKLIQAKAIIFDLRGRPVMNYKFLLPHLIKRRVEAQPFYEHIPLQKDGSKFDRKLITKALLFYAPQPPYLKAKLFFLSNARTLSSGETHLNIIKHYKLGKIIGERSAGTTGTSKTIELPSGFSVDFTSLYTTNYDHSEFKGVAADYEVFPSRAGVRAGKDELLEFALTKAKGD